MMCKSMKPSSAAWLVAVPIMPFVVAGWAGGMARRRGSSCWMPEQRGDSSCGAQPGAASRPQASRSTAAAPAAADLVDTAVAAGSFGTLAKAVRAAGLVDTLKGDGPFTVFAPTDDAFDRLPEGALEELLADKEKLASVLTYHVVPGRLGSAALKGVAAVKTVQGQNLDVDTTVGVKVGSAYVIQSDVETSNGVIHAISSVLLPS
ncbi:MAG: fasciclin domain-containing protein [Acidobacteriota bacterium]